MVVVMVLTVIVLETMVIMDGDGCDDRYDGCGNSDGSHGDGGNHCGAGDDNGCSDTMMDVVMVMIMVVVT
jgi:hypothetical protein